MPRILTMTDLKWKAKQYGGTAEGGLFGTTYCYNCESPPGKVWVASSTHALRVEWEQNDRKWRQDAVNDAIERMSYGVTDCDNPECDYCHPVESE